jgi:hypothetical protein
MAKKVLEVHGGGYNPLEVTKQQGRRLNKRRVRYPQTHIRCGCGCDKKLVIARERKLDNTAELEIGGITGSVAQWRKILRPLLGFDLASRSLGSPESGVIETKWRSAI